MPDPADSSVTVTLAEIARIAGVTRAAVSNWRRRHPNFPAPTGGTDISPLFSLDDVQDWLRAQGKLREEARDLDWLWPQFEALGDRDVMGAAIAAVGTSSLPEGDVDRGTSAVPLPEGARRLVRQALQLAEDEGRAETFRFLLDRWLRAHVRQIVTTPAPLADLMAEIAEADVRARAESEGQGPPTGATRTVLDPACGTGSLLLAAAQRESHGGRLRLLGQDNDPVLAALAAARVAPAATLDGGVPSVDVRVGDTLRDDRWAGAAVDVVLSNPPSNERDWGHEELATDPRWTYGHPPRTEPELAWVQHALAHLVPGGTAVLLLPPGVASRRAGRRVRAALLRAGALRAVVSLPPGAAPPHGVSLHLWVLRKPVDDGRMAPEAATLTLVDTTQVRIEHSGGGKAGMDWAALREVVLAGMASAGGRGNESDAPIGTRTVPIIDLLDEQVDLTPARHVPAAAAVVGLRLRRSWSRFGSLLHELQDLTSVLARLELDFERGSAQTTTIDELVRASAVQLRAGQAPAEGSIRGGGVVAGGVPVLTAQDVLQRGKSTGWLPIGEVSAAAEKLTVTAPDEVIVVGVARAFDAWVDTNAPTVLGPQLFALRTDPSVLDPWFVAGCLRAPANGRQAGSHASTASRINVRRLHVLRLPLDEQRRYGDAFRRLATFERTLAEVDGLGRELVGGLSDGLSAGGLPRA
ncbi:N-6 DNA methylase [Streptomyces sp. SID3343]|uniref:N-6 DNA methylase n=1 Tax=Streptomyces sp. SID3343 TaxID=2690260 RepID=UPI0013686ACC|nr:N-6 DNA methylase [Streptomyces sp. SID3343]MYW05304.1 N-6 DNA methylase [Streptomyces sp. SID3343]